MKNVGMLAAVLSVALVQSVPARAWGSMRAEPPPRREMAITIDDLPEVFSRDLGEMKDITKRLLQALASRRVPAIGFVNEGKLYVRGEVDERIDLLRMWLDAGMTLGNHTFSHTRFHTTPLNKYTDDVIRGEVVTRRLMRERGVESLYFRHPFTSTGPTKEAKDSFEAFLKERDYRVAPFTVEHVDYAFNAVYVRAREKRDTELVGRVRAAYLEHLDTACDYMERRSRETLGREPRQILLIHANRINADCLAEMLARLERRGYAFVSLDDALRDEAYRIEDKYVGPMGISWVHRWSYALGIENKFAEEPDPPKFIFDLYREAQAK